MKHEESYMQEAVIAVLQRQYKDALWTGGFAGEKLSIGQAMRRKRMGYRAGSPDIILLEPKGKYYGLFIEMKSSKGVQSPSQKEFELKATERGYKYVVCNSARLAVTEISNYMAQGEHICVR